MPLVEKLAESGLAAGKQNPVCTCVDFAASPSLREPLNAALSSAAG
jgi:hypothetical protein